jgi:hypothetical protein
MRTVRTLIAVAALSCAALSPALDASWNTTSSGGRSTGGTYTVTGTIGEPANGRMSGGGYEVTGGFIAVFLAEQPPDPPEFHPADINQDGVVNAVDVQLVINAALGLSIVPYNADINGDGTVNAVDVQLVINAALGIGM